MNCTDCMFTFGVWAKRYFVANVELPKDKYMALKTKLVGEIAAELKETKRFRFSIIDLLNDEQNGKERTARNRG